VDVARHVSFLTRLIKRADRFLTFAEAFPSTRSHRRADRRPRVSPQVFGDKEQYHDNPDRTCGKPEIAHLDHPMTHPRAGD
jgi:hypothetical protein